MTQATLERPDLATVEGPFYLYAVARNHPDLPEVLEQKPIENSGQPFLLRVGDLIVVLSANSSDRYSIARKNLLAHKTIVETIMAITPVLPVRFNTIGPSLEVIERKLLTQKADELKAKLDAVDGRVELSVRATWTDPAEVINRVLGEHPEISSLRDKIADSADHHARIRLGQMMENAILKRRDYVGAALEKRLVGLVEGISNGTLPEGVVANLSVLMPQAELEKVENALHEFDDEHDLLTIRLTGPLPPFTFSEMTVRWEDDEE
jgi:hypothetical protein